MLNNKIIKYKLKKTRKLGRTFYARQRSQTHKSLNSRPQLKQQK
jgi:hypothetical protein